MTDALDASASARPLGSFSVVKFLIHTLRVAVQAVMVIATLAGAGNVAWGVSRLPDHPDADITHFLHWTRVIAVRGMEQAYAGVYPETYLIYPPGSAWVYRGAVEFAQRVPQPGDISPPPSAMVWMDYLNSLPLPPVAPSIPDAEPPAEDEAPAPPPEDVVPEQEEPPSSDTSPEAGNANETGAPPVVEVPIRSDTPVPATQPVAPVPIAPSRGPQPDSGSDTSIAPPTGVTEVTPPVVAPDASVSGEVPSPVEAVPEVLAPDASSEDADAAPPTDAPSTEKSPEAPDALDTSDWNLASIVRLSFSTEASVRRGEGETSPPDEASTTDQPPQVDASLIDQADARGSTWVRPVAVRAVPGIDDAWLRIAVKLMPVAGHLVLSALLFVIVAGASKRFWRGWLAMAAYAWNPGPIFDTAYWGQGDSIHTALLLAAVGAIFVVPSWWPLWRSGKWRIGVQLIAPFGAAIAGTCTALACLTKPQAWIFLPFLLWIAWKRTGPVGLSAFFASAITTGLAVIGPWRDAGTLDDALSVFGALTQVMPSVSANGHNLWWLKLGPGALAVFDSLPVGGIGPVLLPGHLTFATTGRLGFGALALVAALRLTGQLNLRLVVTSFAYIASAYFMTITQVHENHQFAAVPFLAAAAALDLTFLPVLVATSIVMFTNMAIHDFLWGQPMTALYLTTMPWLERFEVVDGQSLQMANAWVNVGTFAVFSLLFLLRPTTPTQSATYLAWRARLTMLAGLALGGGACYALWRLVNDRSSADALWQLFALGTASVPIIDKHLGLVTTVDARLGRAAVEYINLYYVLGAVAAIVAWQAALAGAVWSLQSLWIRRRERRDEALARDAFRQLETTTEPARQSTRVRVESYEV